MSIGMINSSLLLEIEIETTYNFLKNRMNIEEFSGIRERLVRQDIYCYVWLFNLVNFCIIELNETLRIPQEQYKYGMSRNISVSIGYCKNTFYPIPSRKISRKKTRNYG